MSAFTEKIPCRYEQCFFQPSFYIPPTHILQCHLCASSFDCDIHSLGSILQLHAMLLLVLKFHWLCMLIMLVVTMWYVTPVSTSNPVGLLWGWFVWSSTWNAEECSASMVLVWSVLPVVPSASAISEWCSCDNCTTLSLHIFLDSL